MINLFDVYFRLPSSKQEALTAFKDVMKQLSRDIPPSSPGIGLLPRKLMLEAGFKFMDAYEAEGLLGVCVFLVKVKLFCFLIWVTFPQHFDFEGKNSNVKKI